MKALLKATVFVLLILVTAPSYVLANPSLDNAIRLYQAKEYGKALVSFTDIYRGSSNPTAYCYAANCHYALGQKSEAINLYWYVVKTFPNAKEAYSSRAFLKQIDPSYAKHSYHDSSTGIPKDAVATGTATGPNAAEKPIDPATINSLIKVIKAEANRPNVSVELIKEVQSVLATYPVAFIDLLKHHGTKIYLTPTMIDKEPGLQNTRPRGYEDGSTYKNCPGMFSYPDIIVCAYALKGTDDESWEPTSDPIGTLRHELGHAFDSYLGRVSQTEEFKHAYYLDCGTVNEDAKNQIAYYLQKAEGGPSETFAELFCCKYGASTTRKERSTLVQSSFPRCEAILNKLIASLH